MYRQVYARRGNERTLGTYLIECLFVCHLGALEQFDGVFGALHNSRLYPQPMPQLLDAVLKRQVQGRLEFI